ncbi:MAG: hypothetical protein VX498_06120 [Myxococcota bacterium]|nr:hypothetical protein [Myxococcota bacterium]
MSAPEPQRRSEWLQPVLILGLSALVCIPGIEIRDLTGDELGTLGGTIPALLDRSLEVHRPDQFSAHLPLAWLIRSMFHSVLGTDWAWIWRLHALLGVLAGTALTWWVVRRYASLAIANASALFVGLAPVLTFHARDSTNYALDPLTGAALLGGMAAVVYGTRRAGLLLALGLVLGSTNDYYFLLTVGVAFLLSPLLWLWAEDRRAALRALGTGWGIYAALALGPAIILYRRIQGVDIDKLLEKHADIDHGSLLLADYARRKLDEFALSSLEGYEGVWVMDPWASAVAGALITFTVAWGLFSRDRLTRISALLVGGTALVLIVIGTVFQNEMGRAFPLFPRNYLNILPAIAILWSGFLLRPLGTSWALPGILALVLLLGGASLRQALNVSDTRVRLMERVEEERKPGDFLLTEMNLHLRLDEELFQESRFGDCVPDEWELPDRLWYWRLGVEDTRPELRRCSGTPVTGYRVRMVVDAYSPPHDHQTNSHLTPIRVYLYERGLQNTGNPRAAWQLELEPRFGSGAGGAEVSMAWEDIQGERKELPDRAFAPQLHAGPAPQDAFRLRVQVRGAPLPTWLASTSLAPPKDELMNLSELTMPDDVLSPRLVHPVWALSSPWYHVARQVLLWVLWFSLLAALAKLLVETGERMSLRIRKGGRGEQEAQ